VHIHFYRGVMEMLQQAREIVTAVGRDGGNVDTSSGPPTDPNSKSEVMV